MFERFKRAFLRFRYRNNPFPGSSEYWERRYATGGTSGDGSYGDLAEFKAKVINDFVNEKGIDDVMELGCGDGNQLSLLKIPRYLGLDISETAVEICENKFASDETKKFEIYSPSNYGGESLGVLALSLDILFHLVEDEIFHTYMNHLFQMASDWVIIYSSDSEEPFGDGTEHCRNRKFTTWVKDNSDEWELVEKIDNKYPTQSVADFYIYKKRV
uniref:Glycosyl transferase n=1 Tax=uncultured marine group II/III euryarchaeote KM3_115_D04 TaxID=1457855 RepID=A0A075GC90_9EURY|nr:glycosyl transferase [uncultured marine group II/III euryarchaeote KM3_115_D04]